MQPDMHTYYQSARDRSLRRVERTLVWVTVMAAVTALGVLLLSNNLWGKLVVVAAYLYLWLPVSWCIIIVSLLAWMVHSLKLRRTRR